MTSGFGTFSVKKPFIKDATTC